MKTFKVLCIATMALFMLAFQANAITGENEFETACLENPPLLTVKIPALNYDKDVRLAQNLADASVVIELTSNNEVFARVTLDAMGSLISSDGIIQRIDGDGINASHLISSDGIIQRIDGINASDLISSDGIIQRIDGINASDLISSDGIIQRIDGINASDLISSDGIIQRIGVTVSQGGYVILKDEI